MAGKGKPKTGGRNWKPGQSGNPAGAQPVPVEVKLIKLLSWKELALACSVLLYADQDEIERINADRKEPKLHRIIASALERAHVDGNFFALNQILDRVIGKVKEATPEDPEGSRNGQAVLDEIRKVINDPRNERKG